MAHLTLRARGEAPAALAWERYADPGLWPTWAPQIQGVETTMHRLTPGSTGTVRVGLLSRPTLGLPFTVLSVDEPARQWSWQVRLGPVTLHLEHGVTDRPGGSATWLRVRGPLPILLAYAPVARFALSGLVRPR